MNNYRMLVERNEKIAAAKELSELYYYLQNYGDLITIEENKYISANATKLLNEQKKIYYMQYAKLEQLISYGNKFIMEEFIQIFTLRIEIELLYKVLKSNLIDLKKNDLNALDAKIKEICNSNFKEYISAKQKIENNWTVAKEIMDFGY